MNAAADSLASLMDLGDRVVALALSLGAQEARAGIGRSVSTELTRRDGRIEKAEESRSLGLRVSLLVEDRFSAHATSDLRPAAIEEFLTRAVEATRFLEPDPDRRLTEAGLMGTADPEGLDAWDDAVLDTRSEGRRQLLAEIEDHTRQQGADVTIRSVSSSTWDGRSERVTITSNGFRQGWRSTSIGSGVSLSLEDVGGRLPEAWFMTGGRHTEALVQPAEIARIAVEAARHRLGSGPAASGRYPMLVDNRIAGRVLGILLGPMQAESIYEQRSCLADKLGARVAAAGFSIHDDPLIPRAPGSYPYDGDCLPARPRTLVQDGVLQQFLVDVYNGRRLGWTPNSGSTGNLILPPGTESPEAILARLPRAIKVEGFLGGNTNPTSGAFSFGVHGVLYENGQPVRNISEMNVSGDLFELFERFAAAGNDVWTRSSWRTPSVLFDDIQFSGS